MRHFHIRPVAVFTALVVAAGLSIGDQQSEAVGRIPDDAVFVDDSVRPALGDDGAPVVMVVFTDYQCRYCKKFFEEGLPALRGRYVNTGELRIVVRDMPLPRHRSARPAATAAACAERQGEYWSMHEALYAWQETLPDVDLGELAGSLGLDRPSFEACMAESDIQARIEADLDAARGARVSGTPAFLIGVPEEGRIYGRVIVGYQPTSVYEAEIREYLTGSGSR